MPRLVRFPHTPRAGAAVALFWALAAPAPAVADSLLDKVVEGAAGALEKGGELLGGDTGGLELGRTVVEQGFELGKQGAMDAARDALEHFDRQGTPAELRARVDAMVAETLERLFAQQPEARTLFAQGYGHGVFEVRRVSLGLTAGYGYGVASINRPEGDPDRGEPRRIYMKLATAGVELTKGLGGSGNRWVVLLADRAAFDDFVAQGLDGGAEAGGTLGTRQAQVSARARDGVAFYRVTGAGLKLAARLEGTRVWPDDRLNDPEVERVLRRGRSVPAPVVDASTPGPGDPPATRWQIGSPLGGTPDTGPEAVPPEPSQAPETEIPPALGATSSSTVTEQVAPGPSDDTAAEGPAGGDGAGGASPGMESPAVLPPAPRSEPAPDSDPALPDPTSDIPDGADNGTPAAGGGNRLPAADE